MTLMQNAILLMLNNIVKFFTTNAETFDTYTPMKNAITEVKDGVTAINEKVGIQQTDIKGYTTNKKNKRKTMATLADAMRRKLQGMFSDKDDTVEYEKLDIPFSKMMYGKATRAKLLADQILETARGVSPADKTLYAITDEDLDLLLLSISEYDAVMVAPRTANNTRHSATLAIPELVKKTMKVVETKCDKLIGNYAGTELYSDYFIARILVDPSYKITTVEGLVKSATTNSGIYGVKVTTVGKVSGKVYEDMTNTTGAFIDQEISPEVVDITFEVPDFMPVTLQNVDLHAGEHQKLNVVLQPVA